MRKGKLFALAVPLLAAVAMLSVGTPSKAVSLPDEACAQGCAAKLSAAVKACKGKVSCIEAARTAYQTCLHACPLIP